MRQCSSGSIAANDQNTNTMKTDEPRSRTRSKSGESPSGTTKCTRTYTRHKYKIRVTEKPEPDHDGSAHDPSSSAKERSRLSAIGPSVRRRMDEVLRNHILQIKPQDPFTLFVVREEESLHSLVEQIKRDCPNLVRNPPDLLDKIHSMLHPAQ